MRKKLVSLIREITPYWAEVIADYLLIHGWTNPVRCNWCNGDYNTKIMATAIRYHSNGNMDGYEMKVNYCPNCGASMRDGDGDG